MAAASRRRERVVTGLLLAAGSSTRFGGDKLAAALPGHALACSVLEASARALVAACPHSLAALPPAKRGSAQAQLLQALGLRLLFPERSHQGMGATLAALAQAMLDDDDSGRGAGEAASSPVAGCIVMLADLPFIRAGTIARVAQALIDSGDARAVVVPTHAGQRGHPVAFGAAHGPALAALQGDQGARRIVDAAAAEGRLHAIEVDDPGIVHDVDTPQALADAQGLRLG